MQEILTIDQLAEMLQMSKRQIYTMCESRTRNGSMKENPLPVLRINGNLRFHRASIEEWLLKIEGQTVVVKLDHAEIRKAVQEQLAMSRQRGGGL